LIVRFDTAVSSSAEQWRCNVTRSRGLQFTWIILILTQFGSINSSAQNSLIKTALETPNHVKDDITSTSTSVSEERPSVPPLIAPGPKALTTRDPGKLSLVDRAYLDVFTILNEDSSCSRFFGGRNAIAALNEMVERLKPRYFDHDIAIRMTGQTTLVQSHATGFTFRVFERMELNMAGSFFRSPSPSERHYTITPIYRPNSRETRMVVFLHELGHLVRGDDNKWLLTDDGDDSSQSLDNTERIISACREQITSLAGLTAAQELQMATTVAEKAPNPSTQN
jgi:hypothetical protein